MGNRDKHISVHDFASLYFDNERVAAFWKQIRLYITRHKEDVILEPCSKKERANGVVVDDLILPYFYFHLPVIYDLEVLIPFTLFMVEFLVTANVALYEITPND